MSSRRNEAAQPELYEAPGTGQPCLRVAGRVGRRRLPLPPSPPPDVAPADCFLCHPESDRFYAGRWPGPGDGLHVVGNAFPLADRAVMLVPDGESWHESTLAALDAGTVTAFLTAAESAEFLMRFGFAELDVLACMNVGQLAAQSRRHPHWQVVGFRRELAIGRGGDRAALVDDLDGAAAEGRTVPLGGVDGPLVIPRRPSMTAEVWIPRPRHDRAEAAWSRALQQAVRLCERAITGSYNVVVRRGPDLIRLIPRGLSERAGLELAAPTVAGSVVAATVEETVALWRQAAPAGERV